MANRALCCPLPEPHFTGCECKRYPVWWCCIFTTLPHVTRSKSARNSTHPSHVSKHAHELAYSPSLCRRRRPVTTGGGGPTRRAFRNDENHGKLGCTCSKRALAIWLISQTPTSIDVAVHCSQRTTWQLLSGNRLERRIHPPNPLQCPQIPSIGAPHHAMPLPCPPNVHA
jgi:hypothetical protein